MMGAGGGVLLVGLYVAVVMESASMGFVLNYVLIVLNKYAATEPEQRDPHSVLLFTFVLIGLIGHLVTIPCLCYSVQTFKAKWLIPYMVWRMFLSLLIIAITAWQVVAWPNRHPEAAGHFMEHFVPIAAGAVLVGTLFFAFAMRAHREFSAERIQRSSQSDLYS